MGKFVGKILGEFSAKMTDPAQAMQSFQQLLLTRKMQLEPGRLDTNLYSYVDEVDGTTRFTLVRLEGKTVTAFVVFAQDGTIEGNPCFAIGYAVPEAYRNQGRAKEIVKAALAEMQGAFRSFTLNFMWWQSLGLTIDFLSA